MDVRSVKTLIHSCNKNPAMLTLFMAFDFRHDVKTSTFSWTENSIIYECHRTQRSSQTDTAVCSKVDYKSWVCGFKLKTKSLFHNQKRIKYSEAHHVVEQINSISENVTKESWLPRTRCTLSESRFRVTIFKFGLI